MKPTTDIETKMRLRILNAMAETTTIREGILKAAEDANTEAIALGWPPATRAAMIEHLMQLGVEMVADFIKSPQGQRLARDHAKTRFTVVN